MTVQAILFLHLGWMIALYVELLRKFKYFPWAVFNTVPTPLTSFLNDMNPAPCDLDFTGIKGNPPVFHNPVLKYPSGSVVE